MAKSSVRFVCTACGQRSAQWAGRCSGCGAWGELTQEHDPGPTPGGRARGAGRTAARPRFRRASARPARASPISIECWGRRPGRRLGRAAGRAAGDRQVDPPAAVAVVDGVHGRRPACWSPGEESRGQVASRARRLGVPVESIAFAPGRDLTPCSRPRGRCARPCSRSIRCRRSATSRPRPSRAAWRRSGRAPMLSSSSPRQDEIAVVLAGHVTKDGDLAGPRALEHAVDVVLDVRGRPPLGAPDRLGREESFRHRGGDRLVPDGRGGLGPIDPSELLCSGGAPSRRGGGAAAGGPPGAGGRDPGTGRGWRGWRPPTGDGARPPALPAGGGRDRAKRRRPDRAGGAVRGGGGRRSGRRPRERPRGGGRAGVRRLGRRAAGRRGVRGRDRAHRVRCVRPRRWSSGSRPPGPPAAPRCSPRPGRRPVSRGSGWSPWVMSPKRSDGASHLRERPPSAERRRPFGPVAVAKQPSDLQVWVAPEGLLVLPS